MTLNELRSNYVITNNQGIEATAVESGNGLLRRANDRFVIEVKRCVEAHAYAGFFV